MPTTKTRELTRTIDRGGALRLDTTGPPTVIVAAMAPVSRMTGTRWSAGTRRAPWCERTTSLALGVQAMIFNWTIEIRETGGILAGPLGRDTTTPLTIMMAVNHEWASAPGIPGALDIVVPPALIIIMTAVTLNSSLHPRTPHSQAQDIDDWVTQYRPSPVTFSSILGRSEVDERRHSRDHRSSRSSRDPPLRPDPVAEMKSISSRSNPPHLDPVAEMENMTQDFDHMCVGSIKHGGSQAGTIYPEDSASQVGSSQARQAKERHSSRVKGSGSQVSTIHPEDSISQVSGSSRHHQATEKEKDS
ncbi:hypothetical protein BDW74DRAFT_181144 [Aspergillus multicolor]|uniref:uncharacterized protein n=1 Tax=Aspergillus multicolor TaxID=41759 RepID=UPI003CCD4BC0